MAKVKQGNPVIERKDLTKLLVVFLSVFFSGNQTIFAQNTQNGTGSLLWEITGKGLAKPSYLFGTVHVYDTNVFKLPKQLFAKIKQCNNLVLEMDFGEMNQMAIMNRMFIQSSDSTLDKLMNPDAYSQILQLPFAKFMPESQIKKMKPVMLTSMMLMDNPMQTPSSVDMDLYTFAIENRKKIIGLETMEEQMDAIDAIPLAEQVKMLEESLKDYTSPKEMLSELLTAYKEQDFKHFEDEMEKSDPSALFSERLIDERNKFMTNKIDSAFTSNVNERSFIGVGAMHINDMEHVKGIVSLLRDKGYTLKPLKVKFE